MDLATVGRRGRLLILRTPASIRLSIWRTSLVCGRRASICPLPLTQTYSVLPLFHWGFVPPLHFLGASSPLWPGSYLGLLLSLFATPWTLEIFPSSLRRRIFLGWASYYESGGCQMSLWGLLSDLPPFGVLLAYRPRRPVHFSQFVVRTFCSWAFGMSRLHSSIRRALLYSRRGLDWLQMKFSPDHLCAIEFGFNPRRCPWNLATDAWL